MSSREKKEIEIKKYELNPKYCLWCGKKLPFEKRYAKCCNQSCANSYSNKKRGRHSDETKQKISESMKKIYKEYKEDNTKKIFFLNKPQTYITYCKYCGEEIKYFGSRNFKRYCSKECKHNYLSEHTGGYRLGSGHSKSGWYKGIRCDSTWELAFLIYHLDHNLFIKRCEEKRKYIWKGKEHIYYPDFITDKGIIEIKGYKTNQSEEKRKQNPDIINIYKEDIKFYIDYVEHTYEKKLIELYDGSKPINSFLNNKKFIWMHNDKLKKNTMIYVNKYNEYINLGWAHGRKKY